MSIILKAFDYIKIFLFPDRCPYCNRIIEKGELYCDECRDSMPELSISKGIANGYRCVSAFEYSGKYRRALLQMKIYGKIQYCDSLAYMMYKAVNQNYDDMIFDYISYVPMYKRDFKRRGFNQSEQLALALGKYMKIPVKRTLIKIKPTKKQHTLKYKDRVKNLRNAFVIADGVELKGKSVLLVDDVVTTGSTLAECAKTLQKARPQLICCVTLNSTVYR